MRQLDCWRVHVRKLEFEGLRAFPTSTPTLDKVKAMVSDLQSIGDRCQLLVLVHVIGLSAPTISHLGDIQIASQHVQSNVTLQPKNLKSWIKRRIQLRGFIITT